MDPFEIRTKVEDVILSASGKRSQIAVHMQTETYAPDDHRLVVIVQPIEEMTDTEVSVVGALLQTLLPEAYSFVLQQPLSHAMIETLNRGFEAQAVQKGQVPS